MTALKKEIQNRFIDTIDLYDRYEHFLVHFKSINKYFCLVKRTFLNVRVSMMISILLLSCVLLSLDRRNTVFRVE